jgi:NADH-quinone oxidoreductase subunit C
MSKKEEILKELQALLPEDAIQIDDTYRAGIAFSAQVDTGKLRECMVTCDETGLYLESLTALDFQDTLELVYHMNCYEPRSRFALRVLCSHDQSVPTVSDIFSIAMWKEREVHDFFGIYFTDHPDLRPLLLPEDADFHPLRKDFGSVHAYRKREEIYG